MRLGRTFLALAVAATVSCDPPRPHPVPAARLPTVQEIAGRYEEQALRKSLRKTLDLRADGTFTLTTVEQESTPVTRTFNGTWVSRRIAVSGALELQVTPFVMPDGKTPVDSLSMPIETCGGVLCFTCSEAGVFVREP